MRKAQHVKRPPLTRLSGSTINCEDASRVLEIRPASTFILGQIQCGPAFAAEMCLFCTLPLSDQALHRCACMGWIVIHNLVTGQAVHVRAPDTEAPQDLDPRYLVYLSSEDLIWGCCYLPIFRWIWRNIPLASTSAA